MALDLDQADCRATAEAMAREASALRQRPLPDTAWRIYLRCMSSKGWVADKVDDSDTPLLSSNEHRGSRGAPAPDGRGLGRATPSPTLAQANCTDAPSLAGEEVQPPKGFVLVERSLHGLGPAMSCAYRYHGLQGAILSLEIQRNEDGFLPVAAPVGSGFLLVDRGHDAVGDLKVSWATTTGRRNGTGIRSFTAFAFVGDGRERLAVAVAAPLAASGGPVLPGLRISHERRESLLDMAHTWREWLARALDRQ
ncbi:hypothetical protein V6C53_07430 [Desulfocurvibacter africanus]|uniref:hypothetical protein n=1 Tax=Desulfocurvibacter africanus TaxID=873 RepID=UPI002FDB234C